ncbi:MAG: hypothetical protein IT452_06190 [Planctomycetia bacterium]|nr:hypothetical protein [Planctomycetia bacterium]
MLRPAFAALLLCGAVLAQETFSPSMEEGAVWTETTEGSLTLRMKVTEVDKGKEGATREQGAKVEKEERRETRILEASKGVPAALRATWVTSRERLDGGEARATALEGRTVEIRGREARPADAPEAAKAAARGPEPWRALLPSGPRSPGESWTVPAAALSRLLLRGASEEPSDASEIKVTFARVSGQDDARIATLTLSGTIAVDSRQDFRVQFDVEGELLWDLSSGHPVSLTLAGKARALEGTLKDSRGEIVGKVTGEGSEFAVKTGYSVR